MSYSMIEDARLLQFYLNAKSIVHTAGHAHELAWQEYLPHYRHSEREILAEAAWAILSIGMADRAVRVLHPKLVRALDDLPSAAHLVRYRRRLRQACFGVLRHARKLDALFVFAAHLNTHGVEVFLERLNDDPFEALEDLPFFGPASSLHLAKNLGVAVAKPDRHVLRLCALAGEEPQAFCNRVAAMSNDTVHVVDYVFWRYLSLQSSHLDLARQFLCPPEEPACQN